VRLFCSAALGISSVVVGTTPADLNECRQAQICGARRSDKPVAFQEQESVGARLFECAPSPFKEVDRSFTQVVLYVSIWQTFINSPGCDHATSTFSHLPHMRYSRRGWHSLGLQRLHVHTGSRRYREKVSVPFPTPRPTRFGRHSSFSRNKNERYLHRNRIHIFAEVRSSSLSCFGCGRTGSTVYNIHRKCTC
jgi:hypothetical protein